MEPPQSAHGMRAFFTIWFGQLVSLIGSQLTGFALGVWVYQQTRSVLSLALVQVAQQAPYVLLSPIADLAGIDSIGLSHLAEALRYRPRVVQG
jgi:hypothetical protein